MIMSSSLAKKVEVLELVKQGKIKKEVCLQYGLASSSLSTIIKNEQKIREEFEKNRDSTRLTVRKAPHEELEQALIKWVRLVRERNITLIGPLIQEKANEFALAMGITDFTASNGWLTRFKKRENVNFSVNASCKM